MQLCLKVENFCDGVRVTIERTVFVKLSVSDQTSGRTTQKSVQKSVQKIVDFISENPNITTQEMANLLEIGVLLLVILRPYKKKELSDVSALIKVVIGRLCHSKCRSKCRSKCHFRR